jgi:predicted dehydrogenase
MVLYDDIEPTEKVRVYDRGIRLNDDPNEARRQVLVGYRLGDMFAPVLEQTEALRTGCGHFIDCIRKGLKPQTDGVAGLRVVRLLEAAERSVRNGGAMERWEAD